MVQSAQSHGSNQVPYYAGHNAYLNDGFLVELTKTLPKSVRESFSSHGKWVASAEAQDLARLANEYKPVLKTHDARGERQDVVEFHPAYHALMRRGISIGLNGSIWENAEDERGNRNLARAVRFFLTSQLEQGHLCPLTMTNASIAAMMTDTGLLNVWMGRTISREYDASQRSAVSKKGVTIGMGMTERQGGTDVRANTTYAEKSNDGQWRLYGEKWFFSAPMCDAFLVLAYVGKDRKEGIACFLVPRLLPDGTSNGLEFQRLKSKLGNHSNASSEVKINGSMASIIGEPGRGIATILEMVTLTRLDCILGSAGQMRAALAQAVHHCRHRQVFGKVLIDQPLMTRVLADIALDTVAAQALAMRLAASYDRASSDNAEASYARIMTPAIKYWVCKSAPSLIYEAMECIGGNGYVEDHVMPRLYREAPLNAIWEGSGNVMCLDVMRALKKGPQGVEHVLDILAHDLQDSSRQMIDVLKIAAQVALEDEGSARILTEQLALTAAAAELRRTMPSEIVDAFVESRLGRPWRNTYGMMDSRYDARAIIDYLCS